MLIFALAAAALAGESALAEAPMRFAQLVVREQIIIRVPRRAQRALPQATPIEWRESRGPRCVETKSIAGAALLGRRSVDLILRDNRRVRAEFENCPALDYYYGFYIKPNADGRVCADRDVIRSRIGGSCEIERFRKLTPRPRD